MAVISERAQNHILVVDDDKIIRSYILQLLRTMLPKDGELFEAYDGAQAMQILKMHEVGIVITDMRMTRMSGLQLIEAAHAEWPYLQFIVLSNYDDFDYVRQSFLFGVVNYVLKYQINEALLAELLRKAREGLNAYMEQQAYAEKKRRAALYEESMALGHEVERGIRSGHAPDILRGAPKRGLMMVRMDIVPTQQSPADWQRDLAEQWACTLRDDALCRAHAFKLPSRPDTLRMRLGLLAQGHYTNANAFRVRIQEALQTFFESARAYACVCAAAMEQAGDWDVALMGRLDGAAELVFYLDESKLLAPGAYGTEYFHQQDTISEFAHALFEGRRQDAERIIGRTADKLRQQMPPPAMARRTMRKFVREMQMFTNAEGEYFIPPLALERLSDFKEELMRILSHLPAEISRSNCGYPAIDGLIDQITGNLANPISLDEAAKRTGFSRTHFCRVFKKATGESFNSFVTKKRIEHACVLLQNSGAQLKTVASTVGISDVRYFKKLFAQHTQMNVDEWIKKQRGGGA